MVVYGIPISPVLSSLKVFFLTRFVQESRTSIRSSRVEGRLLVHQITLLRVCGWWRGLLEREFLLPLWEEMVQIPGAPSMFPLGRHRRSFQPIHASVASGDTGVWDSNYYKNNIKFTESVKGAYDALCYTACPTVPATITLSKNSRDFACLGSHKLALRFYACLAELKQIVL